jgi:hypothetical protein
MSRLVHSGFKAYLRYMQISRHQLFAFVEGPADPFFYDGICAVASSESGITYEIATAVELPGGTGGKPGLLNFHSELASRRKLFHIFKGKSIGVIFFFDKDVDDLLRKQIHSRYVVYTECFDLEGHAFRNGSLKEAAAAAAFIETSWLDALLAHSAAWRMSAAERWKEWVQLCLLCAMRNIPCECTFRRPSPINQPPDAVTDPGEFRRHFTIAEGASGLSTTDFGNAFDEIRHFVNSVYARSRHHLIFKGKWYRTILEADVKALARTRNRPVIMNNFGDRAFSTLLQSLNFEDHWAEHFIRPTREMFNRLKVFGS